MKHRFEIDLRSRAQETIWDQLRETAEAAFRYCDTAEVHIMQGLDEDNLFVTVVAPETCSEVELKLAFPEPPWRYDPM